MTSTIRKESNDGLHIERIIFASPCTIHSKDEGSPCWAIDSTHGLLRAICDNRARKSGADGKITPYHKSKKEYR